MNPLSLPPPSNFVFTIDASTGTFAAQAAGPLGQHLFIAPVHRTAASVQWQVFLVG